MKNFPFLKYCIFVLKQCYCFSLPDLPMTWCGRRLRISCWCWRLSNTWSFCFCGGARAAGGAHSGAGPCYDAATRYLHLQSAGVDRPADLCRRHTYGNQTLGCSSCSATCACLQDQQRAPGSRSCLHRLPRRGTTGSLRAMLQGCTTALAEHPVAQMHLRTPATVAVRSTARLRLLAFSYRGRALMHGVWQLSGNPCSRRGMLLPWLLQPGSAWCRPSVQQASPYDGTVAAFTTVASRRCHC